LTQSTTPYKDWCWFETGIGDDQVVLGSHPDYRVQGDDFEVKKKATSED
jgi:hypothetical protein